MGIKNSEFDAYFESNGKVAKHFMQKQLSARIRWKNKVFEFFTFLTVCKSFGRYIFGSKVFLKIFNGCESSIKFCVLWYPYIECLQKWLALIFTIFWLRSQTRTKKVYISGLEGSILTKVKIILPYCVYSQQKSIMAQSV